MRYIKLITTRAIRGLVAAIGFVLAGSMAQAVEPDNSIGAVYVLSNQATANSVLVYGRDANGTLTYAGTYATGGKGAGTGADPLGSQGSLTLGSGFLFAVNSGSNDVSMFAIDGTKLVLLDRESSGGQMPVSITVKGFVVYVVNAGATTPDISGFVIDPIGKRLIPLPGSQRPLAGGSTAQPGQVQFAPDDDELLVTEKGTQMIESWRVNPLGYASGATQQASSGVTPFGFSITNRGYAIVAEAGSGAVSSYETHETGGLEPLSRSIPLGQKAPCWLATTGDGQYAYTANAGSGTISSLAIASDGEVQLLNPVAGVVAAPFDLALSRNSRFLYVRQGAGAVSGFRVAPDGSLSPVGTVTGLPVGAQGIAAR